MGEDVSTLEDVYEPFLVQEGFVRRTARGREATRMTYDHLGLPVPSRLRSGEPGPDQPELPLG